MADRPTDDDRPMTTDLGDFEVDVDALVALDRARLLDRVERAIKSHNPLTDLLVVREALAVAERSDMPPRTRRVVSGDPRAAGAP